MPTPAERALPTVNECAVVFLDLQTDLIGVSRTNSPEAIATTAGALARLADGLGLPTIVSMIPFGHPQPQSIEPLEQTQPSILRSGPKLFAHAASVDRIRSLDRRVLVLVGVLTEVVVLHAALDAVAAGYEVHVLLDACGGLSDRTERAAIDAMTAAGVTCESLASFATALIDDFTTPDGTHVVGALQALLG